MKKYGVTGYSYTILVPLVMYLVFMKKYGVNRVPGTRIRYSYVFMKKDGVTGYLAYILIYIYIYYIYWYIIYQVYNTEYNIPGI